jgi:hypothetical protein
VAGGSRLGEAGVLGVPARVPASERESGGVTRPPAADRLENRDALLTRGDLAELGLERRAIDAVFRECPVVVFPGYSRPMIRVSDYRALLESCTYSGDRVRPT